MTLVIGIQVMVTGLASGLLFERRAPRNQHAQTMPWADESAIEFHPELLVRWDDEAGYAPLARCARRSSVDRRVHVRPQATTSRPHMHIR